MAGVPWHDLNKRFRRDFEAAVAHVLGELAEHGGDPALVEREVAAVLDQLASLDLQRGAAAAPRRDGRGASSGGRSPAPVRSGSDRSGARRCGCLGVPEEADGADHIAYEGAGRIAVGRRWICPGPQLR
jgi:hypothetical protein